MPVASNSVFFGVHPAPPAEATGWEIRVLDYRDFATVVAYPNDYLSLSVTPVELNGSGQGQIAFDADHPMWQGTLDNGKPALHLLDREYLWQAYEDGILQAEWLGRTVEEKLAEDDETRTYTISGPGSAEVLKFALVFAPGFPNPPQPVFPVPDDDITFAIANPTDINEQPGWDFPIRTPAMTMWWNLFKTAQARGTIPWINPLFSETADSGGRAWEQLTLVPTSTNGAYRINVGTNLYDLLDECTGKDPDSWFGGYAEWIMWPGFRLDVRRYVSGDSAIGARRDKQVIFYDGQLTLKERTRTREDIANVVVVQDNTLLISTAADTESVAEWHRREYLDSSHGQVQDSARRNQIAHLILAQKRTEKSEWTVQVPYDMPGCRVFRDFTVGDWIGLASYQPGQPSTVERLRVLAITVTVDSDGTRTAELTLQTLLEARQALLERRITKVVNTPVPMSGLDPTSGLGGPPIDPSTDQPYTYPVSPVWDPNANAWTTAALRTGGCKVFIQGTDPGAEAQSGDFWFDTAYVPFPEIDFNQFLDPIDTPLHDTYPNEAENIPGTNIYFVTTPDNVQDIYDSNLSFITNGQPG